MTESATQTDFPPLSSLLADAFKELEEYSEHAVTGCRWPVVRTGNREPIPWMQRRLIFERDGKCCRNCGIPLTPKTAQLDHITPWTAGGTDCSCNLRLLCEPCNSARSNYRSGLDQHTARRPHVTTDCASCAHQITGQAEPYEIAPGLVPAFCGTCGIISAACPGGVF